MLTTPAQPIEEVAWAAVDEFLQRLASDQSVRASETYSRTLRPSLVVREPSAPHLVAGARTHPAGTVRVRAG